MDWKGEFYQRNRRVHPPAYDAGLQDAVAAVAAERAALAAEFAVRGDRAGLRRTATSVRVDNDLITNFANDGEPIGERIIVHGRVLDENARPVPNALVEVWQANAGGRYRHKNDHYIAPLDPNFGGCGPRADRRGGLLLLPHDQARGLPVAQPRQRLAAGAHPFLGVRLGLRARG